MKEPKEIAFSFQEIDLAEAQNVAAAGDGKYSDLIVMLAKKLPELDNGNRVLDQSERKGFAFGLPGGKEVDEKDRRGLCHTCNIRLKKMNIAWKVTYSGNKKLFICLPRKQTTSKNVKNPLLTNQIRTLYERGFGYGQIAKQLNIGRTTVREYLTPGARRSKSQGRTLALPASIIEFRNKVIQLANAGITPSKIAKQLNAKVGRVNGVYYRYVKGVEK